MNIPENFCNPDIKKPVARTNRELVTLLSKLPPDMPVDAESNLSGCQVAVYNYGDPELACICIEPIGLKSE